MSELRKPQRRNRERNKPIEAGDDIAIYSKHPITGQKIFVKGNLISDDGNTVRLKRADGKEIVIPRHRILSIKPL